MNWKTILLALALFDFSALSAWAVWEHGYIGFFELALASSVSITLFADVVIALSLFAIWMWNDSRERGLAFAPFLVLTLTLGSVGPLLYLILREVRAHPSPQLAPVTN